MSGAFPASAGPWLEVSFDSSRAAARFAKGVREVTGYRTSVDDANPRKVVTNIERWQIAEVLKRQRTSSRNAPLRVDHREPRNEGRDHARSRRR